MKKVKLIGKAKMSKETMMKVDGLSCEFNLTHALKSRVGTDGEEIKQSLPPYGKTAAWPVDEYPACPDNWMHGSAKSSSYFLAVEPGKGAWLDFNDCLKDKYDIAVVVSVQGINSVTGQKTSVMRLEQYKTKCPVHDVEFQQDRFCPECKYKWPAQNYLTTTGTPGHQFWLDGFRSADGTIRQYLITEDEARGVAAKKLGNDRVFAIGIAFYRSKAPKPVVESPTRARGVLGKAFNGDLSGVTKTCSVDGLLKGYAKPSNDYLDSPTYTNSVNPKTTAWVKSAKHNDAILGAGGVTCSRGPGGQHVNSIKSCVPKEDADTLDEAITPPMFFSPIHTPQNWAMGAEGMASVDEETDLVVAEGCETDEGREHLARSIEKVSAKTFEVGAGARINQEVYADPKDLDYWENEPAGMIYVNYTDMATVEKILKAGKREEKKDGFLDDVPVGN